MEKCYPIIATGPGIVKGEPVSEEIGVIETETWDRALEVFEQLFGNSVEQDKPSSSINMAFTDFREDDRWEQIENYPPVFGGKIFTHKESGVRVVIPLHSDLAINFSLRKQAVPILKEKEGEI